MTLGQLISLSRELKGITIRELERLSGVNNASISLIENGRVRDPGFRTVVRIAGALGLSLKRLAETDETMTSAQVETE